MKNKNGLSYMQIVLIAMITELTLIAIQIVYLKMFSSSNEGVEPAFTSEYMKTTGFYIFQIIGFFLYTFVVYVVVGRTTEKVFNKIFLLVIAGGIVELSFYLIMTADYEGAFLFSILDKAIAAALGLILYDYTAKKVKKPGSYL